MIIFGGLVMTISGEIMVILPLLGYFNIWTVILPFAGFAFGWFRLSQLGQAGSITPYPKMACAEKASLLSCSHRTRRDRELVAAGFLNGTVMPLAWIKVFWIGPLILFRSPPAGLRRPKAVARDEAV